MNMTLEQSVNLVRSFMHRHPQGVAVRDAWEVVDAHLTQHAVMVTKLRRLIIDLTAESNSTPQGYNFGEEAANKKAGECAERISRIINVDPMAELVAQAQELDMGYGKPADPVKVDVAAVREVIESLDHTISIPKTAAFNQAKWSAKLATAIGDK